MELRGVNKYEHVPALFLPKSTIKQSKINMPSSTNGHNGTAAELSFDEFHSVINGKLVSSSQTRHGINPATKKALPEVPIATQQDVDNAVAAGKEAFKTWSRRTIEERRAALLKFADAYKAQQEAFAKMLTTEQGKPVSSSQSLS